MCEFCLSTPCLNQCPNAPEPEKICECEMCGEDIREGDEFVCYNDKAYCIECLDNMDVREIVEFFGETVLTAEGA